MLVPMGHNDQCISDVQMTQVSSYFPLSCGVSLIDNGRVSAGLCCTNPFGDSSRESSMVAGVHEQTGTPNLQDKKLASL